MNTTVRTLDTVDLPSVPIITERPQAQGDVIILPAGLPSLAKTVTPDWTQAETVMQSGFDVVKGVNGRHSHTLHAAEGIVMFTRAVVDTEGLAIVAVDVAEGAVALLTHVEHGDMLFGPGRWVIRGQQEKSLQSMRRVED
jgi:hypothetical protein